jgi:hypothetical protein
VERIEALKERIEEIVQNVNKEAEDWAEGRLAEVQSGVERVQARSSDTAQRYESSRILRASHAGDGCSTEIRAAADMKRYKDELKKIASELRTVRNKVGTARNALRSKVNNWQRDIKNEGIRLIRRAEAGEKIDEGGLEEKLRPGELN